MTEGWSLSGRIVGLETCEAKAIKPSGELVRGHISLKSPFKCATALAFRSWTSMGVSPEELFSYFFFSSFFSSVSVSVSFFFSFQKTRLTRTISSNFSDT